jgi:hypothetical protein
LIKELEEEKKQMEQSILELKAKCESIEKRESERRAMEDRKHAEEIAFLKKTNVQLKVWILLIKDAIGRNFKSPKEINDCCFMRVSSKCLVTLGHCTGTSWVNGSGTRGETGETFSQKTKT